MIFRFTLKCLLFVFTCTVYNHQYTVISVPSSSNLPLFSVHTCSLHVFSLITHCILRSEYLIMKHFDKKLIAYILIFLKDLCSFFKILAIKYLFLSTPWSCLRYCLHHYLNILKKGGQEGRRLVWHALCLLCSVLSSKIIVLCCAHSMSSMHM